MCPIPSLNGRKDNVIYPPFSHSFPKPMCMVFNKEGFTERVTYEEKSRNR